MADAIPTRRRKQFTSALRIGTGVVVGLAFVILVIREVDLAQVVALLGNAAPFPLLVAILAFAADFLLRAVRFWMMLRQTSGRDLPLAPTVSPFIASFGLNDVLPLRLGDGFRVVWFSRLFDISAGTVLGTMVVERILDLVTIAILGALVLVMLEASAEPAMVLNFQIALLLAFLAGVGLLFAPALLARLSQRLFHGVRSPIAASMLAGLNAASTAVVAVGPWYRIAWLATISLVIWLLESIVLIGAWIGLGEAPGDILKPFLAFVFSTLGTLAPSLPGHFGAFEFFGVQAFALVGVDASTAVAVVLLGHLILWAPTAIFGICWLPFANLEGGHGQTGKDRPRPVEPTIP